MDFFKSVFSDEDPAPPDPSSPTSNPQSPSQSRSPEHEAEVDHPTTPSWSFVGGLIKTFATKSESVLETYRRDLQEFSTGLKKETQLLKEVASSSLEVGASRAQESLESVGQAIGTIGSVVWKSTSLIIDQGQDSDLDNPDLNSCSSIANVNCPGRKYSRFDALLRGIQCDVNTYVEEPEDLGDFDKWKLSFNLGEKSEEIENLINENGTMDGIYKRVVPSIVGHQLFWSRYYYRVHKLEQAESVRAKLVERANEDEDLSWDVEEEEDNNDDEKTKMKDVESSDKGSVRTSNGITPEDSLKTGGKEEDEILKEKKNANAKEASVDEKVGSVVVVVEKTPSEVGKDSDISVVSSQPSSRGEEEDVDWDEIERVGSDEDEKKGKQIEPTSPSNRAELRKRLSAAEEDEDLSWDIEDDEEAINKT